MTTLPTKQTLFPRMFSQTRCHWLQPLKVAMRRLLTLLRIHQTSLNSSNIDNCKFSNLYARRTDFVTYKIHLFTMFFFSEVNVCNISLVFFYEWTTHLEVLAQFYPRLACFSA